MKVMAVAASHRADSYNQQLLGVAVQHVRAHVDEVSVVAYATLDLPLFNQAMMEQGQRPDALASVCDVFGQADALMIASPEYNWSVPGSLKNVLDWLSVCQPCPLKGMPVFLMSATPSQRGGMMGLSHLKAVCEGLGAFVYPAMFGLGSAPTVLEDGQMRDVKKTAQLHAQLDGFTDFARRMVA